MKLVEAQEKVKAKGLGPLTFLVGDDTFFISSFLASVRLYFESQLVRNLVWQEYEKHDKSSPLALDLQQTDLRFPTKVFLVRNGEKAPTASIKAFVEHPKRNSYIIMQLEKIPEELQRKGMQVDCEPLNERKGEVEVWLVDEAKALGFKLHDTAARFLVANYGNDLGCLHGELEKMSLMFPKKEVSVGDISPFVTSFAGLSMPKVQGALTKKDKRALCTFMREAEAEQNLAGFVGMLFSFLDRWITVRSVKTNDDKDAAQVLGRSPFLIKIDRDHAKAFKAMALWRATRLLASADRSLKSGLPASVDLIRAIEALCE